MYLCLDKKHKYKIIDTSDGVISLLTEDEVKEVWGKGIKIENLSSDTVLGIHMTMPQIPYIKLQDKIVYKFNQSGITITKFGQEPIYLNYPHKELVGIFTLQTTKDIVGAYFLVNTTQFKSKLIAVFWDISDPKQPICINKPFIEGDGLIGDNFFARWGYKKQLTETFPQQPVFIGNDAYRRFKNVSTGKSYYAYISNITYGDFTDIYVLDNEVTKPFIKFDTTNTHSIQTLKMFSTTIVGKILKVYKDLKNILVYTDFEDNNFITEAMFSHALTPMLNAQLLKERQQICDRTGLYDFIILSEIRQTQYEIMQPIIRYIAVTWSSKGDELLVGETDIK